MIKYLFKQKQSFVISIKKIVFSSQDHRNIFIDKKFVKIFLIDKKVTIIFSSLPLEEVKSISSPCLWGWPCDLLWPMRH